MTKKFLLLISLFFTGHSGFGQVIDSLKLNDSEIPLGYTKTDKVLCITPHACSFYEQTDLYESILGKVTKKEFQSFEKKGDTGSIFYFEFESEFTADGFLAGLLWGQNSKPTKSEPDDYYFKGKVLIIWGFNLKSDIKQVSKSKVTTLLK